MPRLASTRDSTAREALTRQFAPIVLLDRREPFPFTRVAATILTPEQRSPSSSLTTRSDGTVVVEYALWSDLEIGHAYEIEHLWIHLDAVPTRTPAGTDSRLSLGEHAEWEVVAVYGSAHGHMRDLTSCLPRTRLASDTAKTADVVDGVPYSRVRVPCEPGKHGFAAPLPNDFTVAGAAGNGLAAGASTAAAAAVAWAGPRDVITTLCGAAAGVQGVHPAVATVELRQRVAEHRRAWRHLRGHAFTPTWEHTRELDTRTLVWEPLPRLLTRARRRYCPPNKVARGY